MIDDRAGLRTMPACVVYHIDIMLLTHCHIVIAHFV